MPAPDLPRGRIEVTPRGPYVVSGGVPLAREPGAESASRAIATNEVYSLCRCGASARKPFCDGTHRRIGFDDSATGEGPGSDLGSPPGAGIEVRDDGPLAVAAGIAVAGCAAAGTPVALCRCGASRTKPFCDGSHRAAGFRDG